MNTKTETETRAFSISIDSIQDYEFRVKFDPARIPDLVIDEPSPLGHDKGPDPARMLATAVGSCLSASFLFCARKLRLDIQGLHTGVTVTHTRNEKGRLRIGNIEVTIDPQIGTPDEGKMRKCLDLYEEFCVVTQSVRKGLDVSVNVGKQ